jgi:hypothetical protein
LTCEISALAFVELLPVWAVALADMKCPFHFFLSLTHLKRVSALIFLSTVILYNVWYLLFCKNVWPYCCLNTNFPLRLTSKYCSGFMNSMRVFCVVVLCCANSLHNHSM